MYNPDTNRLHRLTFSKSLADLLAHQIGLEVKSWGYRIAELLEPGQVSPSGLYALLDAKTGLVLRIALDKQIAELHCDKRYRKLAAAWLT